MSEEAKEAGSPTQDERVMAAVAHATIIFSAVGLIGPLIIMGHAEGEVTLSGLSGLAGRSDQA